uniref:Uncharacterized protein n=1 Tax=Glossina pallidipes TaxID=7398 RepID=A0A1A9ZQT5_GLOPL
MPSTSLHSPPGSEQHIASPIVAIVDTRPLPLGQQSDIPMLESQRCKIADTSPRQQEPDDTLDGMTPVLKQQPSLPQQQVPTEISTQTSPTSQRMPTYSNFNIVTPLQQYNNHNDNITTIIVNSTTTTVTTSPTNRVLTRQQRQYAQRNANNNLNGCSTIETGHLRSEKATNKVSEQQQQTQSQQQTAPQRKGFSSSNKHTHKVMKYRAFKEIYRELYVITVRCRENGQPNGRAAEVPVGAEEHPLHRSHLRQQATPEGVSSVAIITSSQPLAIYPNKSRVTTVSNNGVIATTRSSKASTYTNATSTATVLRLCDSKLIVYRLCPLYRSQGGLYTKGSLAGLFDVGTKVQLPPQNLLNILPQPIFYIAPKSGLAVSLNHYDHQQHLSSVPVPSTSPHYNSIIVVVLAELTFYMFCLHTQISVCHIIVFVSSSLIANLDYWIITRVTLYLIYLIRNCTTELHMFANAPKCSLELQLTSKPTSRMPSLRKQTQLRLELIVFSCITTEGGLSRQNI